MPDYSAERRAAEAIAREAGKRVLRASHTHFDVALKGENDFVTDVDRATEEFVKSELGVVFGDDQLYGEEFGAATEHGRQRGRCWYVDPIDGTTNFVRGIPLYCVSIALRDGDRWVAGAVYDPNRDELFCGSVDWGFAVNGVPHAVAGTEQLADAVLATGFPPRKNRDDEDNLGPFTRVVSVTRAVRRLGSAALDLAYVACGRLDGFWEFHLNPWDTGAAALFVELAGGRVTTVDAAMHTGFEASILATNGIIHDELIQTLAEP